MLSLILTLAMATAEPPLARTPAKPPGQVAVGCAPAPLQLAANGPPQPTPCPKPVLMLAPGSVLPAADVALRLGDAPADRR